VRKKTTKVRPTGVVLVEAVARTPSGEVFRSTESVVGPKKENAWADTSEKNVSIKGAVVSLVERALKSVNTHDGYSDFSLNITVK
jgi:hypothetical protein